MRLEQHGCRLFCFVEDQHGLEFHVSRLRQLTSGDWRGLVDVRAGDIRLHKSALNLSSGSARMSLVKSLPINNGTNWKPLINEMCAGILDALEVGEPLVRVGNDYKIAGVQYLVKPLLRLNQATLLFGKGSEWKSFLALLLCIMVEAAWADNPFNWELDGKPRETIYLDWETDADTFAWRRQCLVNGLGLPGVELSYRRCARILSDDLEAVQQLVADTDAGLVVIDSAGEACGGEMREAGAVNEFFRAVRELQTTVLVLHHQPKDEIAKRKTPYGSSYFVNNPRSVWHICKAQEVGESSFSVALYHEKSNDSNLFPPIGLRIDYDNHAGTTSVELQDVRRVPELVGGLSLKEQIYQVLEQGAMGVKDIATELDTTEATIRTKLNANKGDFIKGNNNLWGLKSNVIL
ncbi:AAA family ATPase [Chloroflexota bacterium]